MRAILLSLYLLGTDVIAGPDSVPASAPYDAALAQSLGADERGMKRYVLVILKSGPHADLLEPQRTSIFSGHMANIRRLANAGNTNCGRGTAQVGAVVEIAGAAHASMPQPEPNSDRFIDRCGKWREKRWPVRRHVPAIFHADAELAGNINSRFIGEAHAGL